MYDEEKIEDQRKEHNRALVMRVKADAEAKYEKYFNDYQVIGGASQLRTARKYEDLVRICEMALESLNQGCERCLRRYRNGQSMAARLKESGVKSVSVEEAVDLIETAASL